MIVKCDKCGRFMKRTVCYMSIIQANIIRYTCNKCEEAKCTN